MGLAECIAACAFGARKYSNNKVESREFGTVDEVQPEYSLENFLHDNGTELLDFLRYVLESSKQHFNPNYRFRGTYLLKNFNNVSYSYTYTMQPLKAFRILLTVFFCVIVSL